jgi:hypothetical protein
MKTKDIQAIGGLIAWFTLDEPDLIVKNQQNNLYLSDSLFPGLVVILLNFIRCLAVSQKQADANSGRIKVQSDPGKGRAFTEYLSVRVRSKVDTSEVSYW